MARKLTGKSYTWQLGDNPIGSGDAGEVYSVTCVENPILEGVIKKPARIATGGTIQRQAGQIAQESLALARLDGLPKCKAHPPRLLDVAPEFTRGTANFFMVSESAPGEDMAQMLARYRQSRKPFPRRVIITVLDALFDLFSRAHREGVLWNDVKLDHIYWHNPTGGVSVIDWGNAQFLDSENKPGRRNLPRWEDYQQLVDTLGGFLKDYAPELYDDLGWDEFQGKNLDRPQVSVLARRIAYQQEVIKLRVMEYQSLIRVELNEEPNLDRLQTIVSYQNRLNEIGAPWDAEAVLDYSKSLVLASLKNDDRQTAIKATSITWDLFDDSLELPWHLLREYFRNLDIISHNLLFDLVKATMNENWVNAIWNLAFIAREKEDCPWWDHLVPVLRQKALGTSTPRPYLIGRSILENAQKQEIPVEDKLQELGRIIENWHEQGKNFKGNVFDYGLLDFVQKDSNLSRKTIADAKSSFAAGQQSVREIIKAWSNMNWESLQKSLRDFVSWDPERWGALFLAEIIENFLDWLNKLYEGPGPAKDLPAFFDQLQVERPQVEIILGSPPWLKSLIKMLTNLEQGDPVSKYQLEVKNWCPWLLSFETLYNGTLKSNENETIVRETLIHFSKHLKNWSDLDTGLGDVKRDAPQYHSACKKVIENFKAVGNLNANLEIITSDCQKPANEVLQDCCQALLTLINWRGALSEKGYERALEILENSKYQNWRIISHASKITSQWINDVKPLLASKLEKETLSSFDTNNEQIQRLVEITKNFHELQAIWKRIYSGGINNQILENLSDRADSNRSAFLEWRRFYEHTRDRLSTLLYHYDLDLIRQISDNYLRITQHSRQALLSFTELGKGDTLPPTSMMRISERLLSHLVKVEKLLTPSPDERYFPGWIEAIQRINNAQSYSKMRELVLNLAPEHPLYAWLVQSLLMQ